MADEQYQDSWSQPALPDTSPDWTIGNALQKYANPAPVTISPENSSLNLLFDKHEIDDMLGSGPDGSQQSASGGLLAGVPQPDYSVGRVDIPPLDLPDRLETAEALVKEPHVQALMATLRGHEGKSYNAVVGGGSFGDYSHHPNIGVKDSHAAGAYQFQPGTWNSIQKDLKLPDFSPTSQDIAAADLLHRTGATDKLLAGDLDGAIFAAGSQWAGFPRQADTITDSKGRTRGQDFLGHPTFTLDQIRADYLRNSR